ncbi:MAG TPA: twin-arginine translocation signal domain-containing protein [Gaiellaceae bacterium]|jgi:hypothetical protein|nr:twin-arginine translocation signal domain-containing protein [Gaiellaceae bacterium]
MRERLSRRSFLGGAAAAALSGAGIYELVERLAPVPQRRAAAIEPLPEQHLLDLRTTTSEGVEVVEPPRHSEVVTGTIRPGVDLRRAQQRLEAVLRELDHRYAATAAGLGVTLAWGLPYFERHVPHQARTHLPFDRRAGKPALLPAHTFPSDPAGTILEENELAVLLRSDHLAHVEAARAAIFDELPYFTITSVRRGFAGGGFHGGRGLPKEMALAAGVAGASRIPDGAELFLGFTSTQKTALGPGRIANHETLGYVDLRGGYFRHGTHMHLSHVHENLEAWYANFAYAERVVTAFRPGLHHIRQGSQTIPEAPADILGAKQLREEFRRTGRFGHSSSIQPTSRLEHDVVGPDGTRYPHGTAVPVRADFNTLDNPFAWSAYPRRDRRRGAPAAGLHFVVFNPSSDDFHRNRLAMDGILPDGTTLHVMPRTRAQGFNSILATTHRQNFLVPPRAHRAFPLAEL